MSLVPHTKTQIEDQEFNSDIENIDYSRMRLLRVFAVGKTFREVNFSQSDFSNCYLRNCRFVSCDFSGASLKECYLKGARFEGCTFKYTTWEKTIIDEQFLHSCLPSEENLARDLVRSLRVNFAQTGNHEAVNQAASIEVQLTGQHLYNAAYSRQSYYRSKENYNGLSRLGYILGHLRWKFLDLLWGNGESIVRVIASGFLIILGLAAYLTYQGVVPSFSVAVSAAAFHFWGVSEGTSLPAAYDLTLTVSRFTLFGLFMAILVKRLSRR